MSDKNKQKDENRRLAFARYDPVCAHCGFGIPSALEVVHIDYDSDHNDLNNLMILCLNCQQMHYLDMIPDETLRQMRDTPKFVRRQRNGCRVNARQQRLIWLIEEAFRGVELGEGVSLHETIVIDDYGNDAQRRAAREPDEKHDWRKLVDDPELSQIYGVGGLSFYDAEGLRFHLPAYLSLAVKDYERDELGGLLESLEFCLTHFSKYNIERLSILNDAQRRCVREALIFFRDTFAYSPELDEAIEGYFAETNMSHPEF